VVNEISKYEISSTTLISGKGLTIVEDGLIIERVGPEHAGTYTCRASVTLTGEMEELQIMLKVGGCNINYMNCSTWPN
jgi:hypothetical protein